MARNGQRLEFSTFTSMVNHLDRWAENGLATPGAWEDALVVSRSWLDYSARNQVLLASYGLDGPVAGPETWRLVPSTTEGRGCAVRSGEHGWPVRVPVTTGGTEPDPYLGGHRPTRAAVERWEWRPVFEIGQLARRPAPDSLTPVELPATFTGPRGDDAFAAAVRKVAGATVRGSLPRTHDAERMLVEAAGRLRRSKRPALGPELREQVAWLVADRVGHATMARPVPFDPSGLAPRERWERLQDVLEPARKLTAALGVTVGVDLVASPLPRMEIVDDRVVPAGRRHRLPAASLEQLPVARWVTVGPYTPAEWTARGEHASGLGAFLRLNKSAYLVAVENGTDGAAWRLEDIAARTGHGLLAAGSARSLDDARAAAVTAVRDRYPALTAPTADTAPSPMGTNAGWEPMPRAGRAAAAEMRQLTDQITLYVLPAPGGRWQPAIHTPSTTGLDLLPLQRTVAEARTHAELAGRRIARAGLVADPARADRAVAEYATEPGYTRADLAQMVGPRLDQPDADRIPAASAGELVELLGAAGLTPATTVAVLAAEKLDAIEVAALLPMAGVPMPDALEVLRDRWGVPATTAAELLDATAAEMRAAGCTPVDIMATRPRDVLRTLPDDPHLWELAAGAMADGGHSTTTIAAHLVAHAPTPDAFAAGLVAVTEPAETLTVAASNHAHPDQLAVASEALGLSPADTATALAGIAADDTVLDTLVRRCDGDRDAVTAIAGDAGISETAIASWARPAALATVTPIRSSLDLDTSALLDALPPPGPSREHDPVTQLEALTAGIEPANLEPTP